MEELIILGSGIAGLTAAIYTARANLKPLVLSGPQDGGQLMWTTDVENYPGFPDGITGPVLMENCKKQAERFGARVEYGIVTKVEKKASHFIVTVDEEKKIQTKAIIIATGASARWLEIPSEKKYRGRGVSSCAVCDGAFFKGKEVIVVGGGDVAMEDALFMTKFASKVTMVHRQNTFRASKPMQERVFNNKNITVLWNKEVHEILGDGKNVTGVKLKDNKTGKLSDFSCQGVFLAIGHIPNTKFLEGFVELDKKGYLVSDDHLRTSVKGVFAAGDVHDYIYRQAVTAAGSGCKAALEVEKYLAGHE